MTPNSIPPSPKSAVCRLCGQTFAITFTVPIIGEPPNQKMLRSMQKLGTHIQTAHPQQFAMAAQLSAEMMALLLTGHYDLQDVEMQQYFENVRRAVHQVIQWSPMTDEMIAARVEQVPVCNKYNESLHPESTVDALFKLHGHEYPHGEHRVPQERRLFVLAEVTALLCELRDVLTGGSADQFAPEQPLVQP